MSDVSEKTLRITEIWPIHAAGLSTEDLFASQASVVNPFHVRLHIKTISPGMKIGAIFDGAREEQAVLDLRQKLEDQGIGVVYARSARVYESDGKVVYDPGDTAIYNPRDDQTKQLTREQIDSLRQQGFVVTPHIDRGP